MVGNGLIPNTYSKIVVGAENTIFGMFKKYA